MTRSIFFVSLCALFVGVSPTARLAHADWTAMQVQWPGAPGGPGEPGGPGSPEGPGGPPGWAGPGPQWDPHRQYCERLKQHVERLDQRMQYAPPWERDRLGTRYFQEHERLRHECWGQ